MIFVCCIQGTGAVLKSRAGVSPRSYARELLALEMEQRPRSDAPEPKQK
jgi:hypothetical protein